MSQPKITLRQLIEKMDAEPTTPEYSLALLEFLELPDAEQKRILFRALVQHGCALDWIVAQIRK